MKLAEDIIKLVSDTIKEIPKKYVYGWLFIYFGLYTIVVTTIFIDIFTLEGKHFEMLIKLLEKL